MDKKQIEELRKEVAKHEELLRKAREEAVKWVNKLTAEVESIDAEIIRLQKRREEALFMLKLLKGE